MSFENKQFSKLYSDFFGVKINKPEQLESCKMTGVGLKKFCEFYLKNSRSEESYQMAKSDLRVSRLLWFTLGFLAALAVIFGAIFSNVTLI